MAFEDTSRCFLKQVAGLWRRVEEMNMCAAARARPSLRLHAPSETIKRIWIKIGLKTSL
jgi:hypothetical protein